jgi:hypothetical protein
MVHLGSRQSRSYWSDGFMVYPFLPGVAVVRLVTENDAGRL